MKKSTRRLPPDDRNHAVGGAGADPVQLAHHVSGRARFRVERLRHAPPLAAHIELELRGSGGILDVCVNTTTGSVTVRHVRRLTPADIAALIRVFLKSHQPQLETGPSVGALKRQTARIPAERFALPWHTVTPRELARRFGVRVSKGLTEDVAASRLADQGPNLLPGTAARTFPAIVKSQLTALPVLLTAGAAGLSFLAGGTTAGALTLLIAFVNAAIGAFYEKSAEKAVQTVRGAVALRARVLRGGRLREIPFEAVVPGDVLDLQTGTRISADARLIRADFLCVDEAALTGESIPVIKTAAGTADADAPLNQRLNMTYRGTLVVEGSGRAVVVATGGGTVLGRLQSFLGAVFPPEALVARDIRRLSWDFIGLGLGAFGLFGVLSLLRGQGLLRILRDGLALLAGAIPSGLSTLSVSAFALGHRDLSRHRILIRRLRALGNLASTQVVCFDKTGTLTRNRMSVAELRAGATLLRVSGGGANGRGRLGALRRDPDLAWLMSLCVLCNEAFILHEGDPSLEGSSTEKALIRLAERTGVNTTAYRGEHPIMEIFHRTDQRHFMVTVHHWTGERELMAVKGSPLEVLERCAAVHRDGRCHPMTGEECARIEAENFSMAGAGLRVLGVAYRWKEARAVEASPADGAGLVWSGLVGLADPVRREARQLIQDLHGAGIRTAVITGDQSLTAQHIGAELGVSGSEPMRVLDAMDLRRIDSPGMQSVVTRAHVFARLSPTQKLQIIQAYQNAGLSVVMVGDGFNDVLALKVADVGIAMGREGALLARQTADLVLEDDDLTGVVKAIANGRAFYDNVRRSLRFLVAATHVDVLADFVELSGAGPGPSPWQSVWTNLVSLALAADPVGPINQVGPPVPPDEPLIAPREVRHAVADAAGIMAVSGLAGAAGLIRRAGGPGAGRLFWQSASINKHAYALSCRQKSGQPAAARPTNRLLQVSLWGSVGGSLLAVLLRAGGAGAALFDFAALGAGAWLSRELLHPTRAETVLQRREPEP